ncbi:hypothetical protein [Sulfitobacter sp. JL08]|uniref:hypothetical protein n=1 Tax=Sulfitobacter sp. JL08 TaxID=2070369 RepID=UPI0013B3D751|nr:hypothetical protein [Sulfitobacter sp. JL08]
MWYNRTTDQILDDIETGDLPVSELNSQMLTDLVAVLEARLADVHFDSAINLIGAITRIKLRRGDIADAKQLLADFGFNVDV